MGIEQAELSRLRWQCRRGLLENDLILDKFLHRFGASLEGRKLVVFRELLSLDDGDLWDILSGRVDCRPEAEPAVQEVVAWLRSC